MALKEWIEDKNSNYGFVIKANLIERPDKDLRMDDIGLVSPRGDDEFQPFMVGFFKGQEVMKFLIITIWPRIHDYFQFLDDKAKTAHKAPSLENEASSRQSKSKKKEVRQAESTPPSGWK